MSWFLWCFLLVQMKQSTLKSGLSWTLVWWRPGEPEDPGQFAEEPQNSEQEFWTDPLKNQISFSLQLNCSSLRKRVRPSTTTRTTSPTQSSPTQSSPPCEMRISPPSLSTGAVSRWTRFLSSDCQVQEGEELSVSGWSQSAGGAVRPRPLFPVSSLFEIEDEFNFDDEEFLTDQRVWTRPRWTGSFSSGSEPQRPELDSDSVPTEQQNIALRSSLNPSTLSDQICPLTVRFCHWSSGSITEKMFIIQVVLITDWFKDFRCVNCDSVQLLVYWSETDWLTVKVSLVQRSDLKLIDKILFMCYFLN